MYMYYSIFCTPGSEYTRALTACSRDGYSREGRRRVKCLRARAPIRECSHPIRRRARRAARRVRAVLQQSHQPANYRYGSIENIRMRLLRKAKN